MVSIENSTLSNLARSKLFLARLANHPPFDQASTDRFAKHFGDYYPTEMGAHVGPGEIEGGPFKKWDFETEFLEKSRKFLASAWSMQTRESREIVILSLIGDYCRSTLLENIKDEEFWVDADQHNKMLKDDFLRALLIALRLTDRMRRCKNPQCAEPFFFAEKRETQVYCSPDCAKVAQRKAKLDWWTKYGKAWRKKRDAEVRRKKGASRGASGDKRH